MKNGQVLNFCSQRSHYQINGLHQTWTFFKYPYANLVWSKYWKSISFWYFKNHTKKTPQ